MSLCFCTTRNRNVSMNFKTHIQCWSLWSTTSMQLQVTFEDEGPWIHQVNGYFISYLLFCFSGFSSPGGSPARLTWNPGLHKRSERGTRNSRGPGHYCDVCGNWYAASRDRRRHIWRSQVCFSSHYPYLGP